MAGNEAVSLPTLLAYVFVQYCKCLCPGLVAVSTHVEMSSSISNDALAAMRRRQSCISIDNNSLKSVGDAEGRGSSKKFIKVKAMSDRHVIFKIHRGRRERERVMI